MSRFFVANVVNNLRINKIIRTFAPYSYKNQFR